MDRRPTDRLSAGAGAGRAGAGAQPDEADGIFKQILLEHSLEPGGRDCARPVDGEGAEASLTCDRTAQPGRCLLQRRPLCAGERAIPRAGATARAWIRRARDGFAVAAAACDLKLKQLTTAAGAEALPDTHDENGARRLYLLMELARNRDDTTDQQRIVTQMETRFPQSEWLAEALFSSGNMYLLSARLSEGSGVLQLSGRAFSARQECRGGALARRLAELSAGSLRRCGAPLRRADSSLSRRDRDSGGALLARAPV